MLFSLVLYLFFSQFHKPLLDVAYCPCQFHPHLITSLLLLIRCGSDKLLVCFNC